MWVGYTAGGNHTLCISRIYSLVSPDKPKAPWKPQPVLHPCGCILDSQTYEAAVDTELSSVNLELLTQEK